MNSENWASPQLVMQKMRVCIPKKAEDACSLIGLVLLNFITHYLFISWYTFVSDDWDEIVYSVFSRYSLPHLLTESQRPLLYALFKAASEVFGRDPLAYQLLNLATTSLIIILVFLIGRSLLAEVFHEPSVFAFLGAALFCVAFNMDQVYLWGTMFANNVAYILYLCSFYWYINARGNRSYLPLALFSFLIAVFIYELGIFLPLVCLLYDLVFERDWKRSLLFIIPAGIYATLRETHGFGYGWTFVNRDLWTSSQFLLNASQMFFRNFIQELASAGFNVMHGIAGLFSVNPAALAILVVADAILVFILLKYLLRFPSFQEDRSYNFRNAIRLGLIGVAGFLLSHTVISLSQYAGTRHMIFIDFFGILVLIALLGPVFAKKTARIPIFCLILFCILVSQGLSVNWIIAGDISTSVDQSITENAGILSKYHYVLVNGDDLGRAIPGTALKYNFDNHQIVSYLNSPLITGPVLEAMLGGAGLNTSEIHLIYGTDVDGIPSGAHLVPGNSSLVYEDAITGATRSVDRNDYFELNSTNLLVHYFQKKQSDPLFSR